MEGTKLNGEKRWIVLGRRKSYQKIRFKIFVSYFSILWLHKVKNRCPKNFIETIGKEARCKHFYSASPGTYLEPSQTLTMVLFCSIVDVRLDSKYTFPLEYRSGNILTHPLILGYTQKFWISLKEASHEDDTAVRIRGQEMFIFRNMLRTY